MRIHRYLSTALLGASVLSSLCVLASASPGTEENPTGYFYFSTPAEPPSGAYPITRMVYLQGHYSDVAYLGADVDLTMDESGKVLAMSQVSGFEDKKEGSDLARTLYVRTVNGIPVLTANASAGGTYDDGMEERPTKGSGKASIPFGRAPQPQNNLQEVSVTSSVSGKQDTEKLKEKPKESSLYLDATQLNGLVAKDWSMFLNIEEGTDARGVPYVSAGLFLYKPDGSETSFDNRRVKYSPTDGYSVSFSKGCAFQNSSPVLDSKGKQVIDRYSQITFSHLLLKKYFGSSNTTYYVPAAGGVTYKFLGQSGFGQVFNFDVQVY